VALQLALVPFLKSRSLLACLHLNCTKLDNEGASLLSDALNHVCIGELNLRNNQIGDEGIEHLLSSENAKLLTCLKLEYNEIGRRRFDVISHLLKSDDTELRYFSVNVWEESAKMVVGSITIKSQLEILSFGDVDIDEDDPMALVAPDIQNLVCNLPSFESLCQPNHQLKWIGCNTDKYCKSNANLKMAFDIHARSEGGASIIKRLRCKLRTSYFQGEFDV